LKLADFSQIKNIGFDIDVFKNLNFFNRT
jgi:hypothetical protein